MRFCLIDAAERRVTIEDLPDLTAAMTRMGLPRGEVDHANLGAGLTLVVYEFGLLKDRADQQYFTLIPGGPKATPVSNLYAGNAVMYAWERGTGETTDFPLSRDAVGGEFLTGDEAMAAIEEGRIRRPVTTINGRQVWQWPDPAPRDMPERARFGRS